MVRMENNIIAVIEAIEKMLPPLPPKPKQCRDRSAHKGHQWSKPNDDRICVCRGHAFDYT